MGGGSYYRGIFGGTQCGYHWINDLKSIVWKISYEDAIPPISKARLLTSRALLFDLDDFGTQGYFQDLPVGT